MNYPTRILQDFEKIRHENKIVLESSWGNKMANQLLNRVFSKNNPRFIFELIQNANDAKAKKITFVIKDRELEVSHDGRPFTYKDIEGISRSFYSSKDLSKTINDPNIIGQFGIGFKSIYDYCKNPKIYTSYLGKNIGFEIKKTFLPYLVEPFDKNQKNLKKTRFILTLKENLTKDFEDFIEDFSFELLIFIPNINYINFIIKGKKKEFLKKKKGSQLSIISKTNNKKVNENTFIAYDHKFKLNKANKSIKLAFKLKDNKFSLDLKTKYLFSFFRLGVKTGLYFYIHTPLNLNLDRTHPKDDQENEFIKKECLKAIKNCFFFLKNKKYINASFLNILPNENDEYPESSYENFFSEVREYIQKIFKEENLWPCENNIFARAEDIYLHNKITKDFFNKTDLIICTYKSKSWSINIDEKKYPRSSQLGKDLSILNIMNYQIFNENLLKNKKDNWLIKYYYKFIKNKISSSDILIKTTKNTFIEAKDVRFKNELNNEANNCANEKLLNKGKAELKNFFMSCGVKNVDLEDEINEILKSYDNHENNLKYKKIYVAHLKKILKYFKVNKIDLIRKLESRDILFGTKSLLTKKPEDLYIDHEGYPTELDYLYTKYAELINNNKEKLFVPRSLSNSVLIELANELGVHKHIEIKKINMSIYKIPSEKRSGRRNYEYFDSRDYIIDELDLLIEKKDYKISLLIAKTLSNTLRKFFKGNYRHNGSLSPFKPPSNFIETLKKNAWIPDKQKRMHKPEELDEKNIDKKFYKIASNSSTSWLEIIGFGLNTEILSDALKQNYKNINLKKTKNFLQNMNNSDDPDKYLYNAELNSDAEEDTSDQMGHRSGRMHSGYRDTSWEDKNSKISIKQRRSNQQKARSEEQNNKVRNWLINNYKAHCQVCLAGKKVNELVPNETYGIDQKHREKIMEAAHADLGKEGGSDGLDNRLLLCNYHHHGMGDKYRQEILIALENGSAEYNPFSNSNDKGYIVQTKILGHQSIGPKERERENLKVFFTKEHKNYWRR